MPGRLSTIESANPAMRVPPSTCCQHSHVRQLTSIPGAVIELRLCAGGGWLSGWEGELEGSVVPPGDWGFEVGVAGVDELGVVAA